MLRGRRERVSSSALPSTSLLIPPNPAIADPGSSPTARGGILLNPLSKDGTCRTTLSPPPSSQGRSSSLSSSTTSSNRSASLSSQNSRAGYGYAASARRSTSLSSAASTGTSSNGGDDQSPSEGDDAASSSTTSSPRLKFAPLPESGRIRRSNSITLGVAARAQMLQGQGMGGGGGGGGQRAAPQAPHWQQQVYNSSPMWYNGGPMPDNVKTFKDLKPGIKKAWGAITRRRSSSNASSASTSSTTSNAPSQVGGNGGGGSSSEGDISSINEEDEEGLEVETPPSSAAGDGEGSTSMMSNKGKGPESVTLTKEGLLVNQPPGSEMNDNNDKTPLEGGQPLRRKDSDAYSDISSNALSDTETDLDSREALITARGLSESPSYTPGMGPSGHFYNHARNHHHHGHGHGDENHEGVRSGEVTPKRGHSPPRSPVGDKTTHPQHWTPSISEYNQHPYTNTSGSGNGSGSTPGSGANTPRRRMSMGDMSTSFPGGINSSDGQHHSNRKGMSVFGFDEAQLKNRLGQMDLNSRRRKPSYHNHDGDQQQQNEEEGSTEDAEVITKESVNEEEEVPLPVDSKQVKGAGMEVAV